MAAAAPTPLEMLDQLEQARKLALADPAVYSQVVPGIVPFFGPTAALEVQRWGADFIAEAFAAPALPAHQKEQLVAPVIPLLKGMLESQPEDPAVVRSAVQAAASMYPHVFRRTISQPDQAQQWQEMSAIKLNILHRMDVSPTAIRMCCVKFVQKVVQVQTPGLISDPRRPEHNETSIALVPRNHPLLPLANLEAETSGLLDRLLAVVQEQSSDPLMIDSTMNCLAVLIRTRPAIANKILAAVLNYNPLKDANPPLTPRTMVIIKSLERTTKALLVWVLKRMPGHPMEPKIKGYLDRLQRSRTALFSGAHSLKRPAQPIDGMDDVKRQRLEPRFPPMPPPPHSVAHLFTLTEDPSLRQFDVRALPEDLVSMISSALMQHIDSKSLDEAIEEIRQRYQRLQDAARPAYGGAGDDEDDYDPEALTGADTTGTMFAQLENEDFAQPVLMDLGPFELAKPPPLTDIEVAMLSDETIGRVFEMALLSDRGQNAVRQKTGINRLAASANDKDSWLTMIYRIATRAPAGLVAAADAAGADGDAVVKSENVNDQSAVALRIRELLFNFVLDDWRHRLSIAIAWLTEEWYADKIQATAAVNGHDPTTKAEGTFPHFNYWSRRLVDNLLPRFDANDKNYLIRFLSETPGIDQEILQRVKRLTRDPLTVKMCILAMQYLYLMRPPLRETVIQVMEEIWQEGDEDVKSSTASLLNKWRPGFVERALQKHKHEASDTAIYPKAEKPDEFATETAKLPLPVQ